MPFTDRFQLLDLRRDEGARTFDAREIATGRPVYVHLFADPSTPLNRALLAKLETLPEDERHRIIDRGDHEGGLYLVTDRLAEYPGLREWLKAKNENHPRSLDARGAWQFQPLAPDPPPTPFDTAPLPALEPSPIPEPVIPKLTNSGEQTLQIPAPAQPPRMPSTDPGEFTRQFAPPLPPKTVDPAGEPTLEMQAPVVSPAPPPPAKSPVATPPNEPGEFTRLFAAPPVLRPTPSTPTPPPARPNEPGEFTRQFAPPPVLRPAPPPSPQEPGEFTRLFPATPPKPSAPQKVAPPPGEFTRQFQAPQRPVSPAPRVPAPPSPTPPQTGAQPGEFTQMLQAQRPPAPKPPANQASQTGEFTRYFESPMTPQGSQPHSAPLTPPRPLSHPKDAGEFTQIFGRGDIPSPPPPQAPAAPGNPSSANATQAFATPRPVNAMPMASPSHAPSAAPQKPQAPGEYTQMFAAPASLTFGQAPSGPPHARMPDPAPIKRNNSRLPLLLVVGAVVLLIFAVVVYFMMRPHG